MSDLLHRLPLFVTLMGLSALAMLGPAALAAAQDHHRISQAFLYSASLFGILTALIGLATAGRQSTNAARDQLLTLISAFVVLPVMLAVPLNEAVPDTTFFNAYFEMVSSLTTTGATIFDPPERLDPALHLWRALVGWLGGFLVLLAAIAILAPMNLGGFEVLSPVPDDQAGIDQRIRRAESKDRVIRFAIRLFPYYAGSTAALWILLVLVGSQPLFALIMALSTLSTSGIVGQRDLTMVNLGFPIEALLFCFLLIAVSRQTLQNDFNRAFVPRLYKDREIRLAFVLLVTLPLALVLRHWVGAFDVEEETNFRAVLQAFWGALFTTLSFLTTTGFVSDSWATARAWSGLPTPGLILAGLAIIGGGVATTAGGVKLLRVYALYKHGVREMELLVHPHSIGSAGYLGRDVRRQGAFVAWIFFMLFALSIAMVMCLLALTGMIFEETLVFAVASLSTTGPLAEVVLDGRLSYAALATPAKSILIGAMVLGRLETLAIIALFNPDFWRS